MSDGSNQIIDFLLVATERQWRSEGGAGGAKAPGATAMTKPVGATVCDGDDNWGKVRNRLLPCFVTS